MHVRHADLKAGQDSRCASSPVEHIASHRDYSTQTVCPGKNLYRYVQKGYFRTKVAERLAAQ